MKAEAHIFESTHPHILEGTNLDDWSFTHLSRAERRWGPHGYHRYPAKFIPQLVRRIIEEYSAPGALVADPFLGSGTSAVEAVRLRRLFWGTDINPVAMLISRAKSTPIAPPDLHRTWALLDAQLGKVPTVGRRPLTEEEKAAVASIAIAHCSPEERLRYWFPAPHRAALDEILGFVLRLEDAGIRDFFLCAVSNILRGCSIWLSGSSKPQKDLQKRVADPVGAFRIQARDMMRRNQVYWDELAGAAEGVIQARSSITLTLGDARALPLCDGALDLLVTSPPYATCYQYVELHQLTQLLFEAHGLLMADDALYTSIGARDVAGRGEAESEETGSLLANAALQALAAQGRGRAAQAVRREVRALQYYFRDMHAVMQEFARVVGHRKRMVLVIGDSRKRGVPVPTSAALVEMACAAGFQLERRIVRQIPARVLVRTRDQKTGRFSSTTQSDTQVYPEEDVLVFRRV